MLAATSFLIAAFSFAANAAGPSCTPLSINVTAPVFTTSSTYASWTIDPSRNRLFFNLNFSDPHLLYLAKAIGGSGLIRFGGGGADTLTYGGFGGLPPCDTPQPNHYECLNKTTLDALVALSAYTGDPLVIGLNIVPISPTQGPPTGPWNTTGARGLLKYMRDSHPGAMFGVELGNERNHNGFTAPQQSACFDTLGELLSDIWPSPQGRPALIGPDADGAGNSASPSAMITYLAEFVQLQSSPTTNNHLHAMTHHEYLQVNATSVLNASYLDRTGEIARQVVAGIRAVSGSIPIWGGEIGPHTGNSVGDSLAATCGDNLLCGRFGSALWYADAMASKALAGYDLFFRQDLVGASYALVNTSVPGQPPPATYVGGATPSSDYYLLYLWKRLVGRQVLGVSMEGGGDTTTRAYAFCSPPSSPSTVTMVVLNLDTTAPACLQLPSFVPPTASLTYFTLTAGEVGEGVESWGVRLNGVLLELTAEGLLPDLNGRVAPGVGGIQLPPLSISLVVLPSALPLSACA